MFEKLGELVKAIENTNKILPKLLWAVIVANCVNIITLIVIAWMVFKGGV